MAFDQDFDTLCRNRIGRQEQKLLFQLAGGGQRIKLQQLCVFKEKWANGGCQYPAQRGVIGGGNWARREGDIPIWRRRKLWIAFGELAVVHR